MLSASILAVSALCAIVLLHPKITCRPLWRATVTPLASIIGSGFLVLGPLLGAAYGYLAPAAMLFLCLSAWAFGSAIRFNIRRIASTSGNRTDAEDGLETFASWALAFAYVISVAYYLNLLGSFAVSLTPVDDRYHAQLVTTGVFLFIGAVGWTRGFQALEGLELTTVTLKLAIIAGLILGLAVFVFGRMTDGGLIFLPSERTGWDALTLAFGLIITVQGFETSRYLGHTYDAEIRVRSMRNAQVISTGIYVLYALLLTYVFDSSVLQFSETAIIGVMEVVAPVLPALLVAGALAAQFSAAAADASGSGGLISELTRDRLTERASYLLLVSVGIAMTWAFNVFQIISYASRAFAIYYAIQAAIACVGSWSAGRRGVAMLYFGLLAFGLVAALTGQASEGA